MCISDKSSPGELAIKHAKAIRSRMQGVAKLSNEALVNEAFALAGVALPSGRNGLAQVGEPVGPGKVEQGDIILYRYLGVETVGIYLKDGELLSADGQHSDVKLVPVVSIRAREPGYGVFEMARRIPREVMEPVVSPREEPEDLLVGGADAESMLTAKPESAAVADPRVVGSDLQPVPMLSFKGPVRVGVCYVLSHHRRVGRVGGVAFHCTFRLCEFEIGSGIGSVEVYLYIFWWINPLYCDGRKADGWMAPIRSFRGG